MKAIVGVGTDTTIGASVNVLNGGDRLLGLLNLGGSRGDAGGGYESCCHGGLRVLFGLINLSMRSFFVLCLMGVIFEDGDEVLCCSTQFC